MNAALTNERTRQTGTWAHGIHAVAHHATTYDLPRPETIDVSQHPSGQMVLTVRLAPGPLAAWLDTVQVIDEATEYRHPIAAKPPHLQVYAKVRLPDTGTVVVLAGTRAYVGGLSLVGGAGA